MQLIEFQIKLQVTFDQVKLDVPSVIHKVHVSIFLLPKTQFHVIQLQATYNHYTAKTQLDTVLGLVLSVPLSVWLCTIQPTMDKLSGCICPDEANEIIPCAVALTE